MPVYLVHGFRWPRPAIKQFIILNDVGDAAPEYLVAPETTEALRETFTDRFPTAMHQLPGLRFVEQYNPDAANGDVVSQPFAFVADKVDQCDLSLDVTEAQTRGVDNGRWGALMDLKEQLAPKEKLGWYMVFNADEVRSHLTPANGSDEKRSKRRQSGGLKRILSK